MLNKSFSRISVLSSAAVAFMVIAVLGGCSSGGDPQVSITGRVTAGNTADATIRVYDTSGIFVAKPTSDSVTGTFTVRVPWSLADFRVEATGGTSGGTPFQGTMMAEVRGHVPGDTIVYLHPATTLVSAYLRRHPDRSLPEAEAVVTRFLQIPASCEIGAGLRGKSNPYFDHTAFLSAAAAAGGFDSFVSALVTEMDASPTATHPFLASASGSVMLQGGMTDVLAWSGQQFASGALSYAGSNAMSYVLSKFGLDMGGDPLAEVKQKLDQISSQLTLLQSQVKNMGQDLACEIGFYGYEGSVEGLGQETLDNIEHLADLYDTLLHFDPSDNSLEKYQEIGRQKEQIRKETLALGTTLHDHVHSLIVGKDAVMTTGAVKGLSRMLKTCGRYINGDKSAAIQRQYAFLALHQVQACSIIVNYYTDAGLYDQADKEAKKCAGYIKDVQALAIPNTLPPAATTCHHFGPIRNCGLADEVVDSRTNLVWWVGPWIYADLGYELYPNMGWGMGYKLTDPRWMTPTCADMETFLQGVGGDPDPSGWLEKQGFRARFILDGRNFAFATNDLAIRQPPYLIINGTNYGIWSSADNIYEFLWQFNWKDQVDPATGRNPSINGYSAKTSHSVYSNGACGGAARSAKVLLVRPLDPGERYSW
ncbi:MAG: hypothetical protein M1418_00370 [Deltaproteobacteria bacterium]|nr:hypothetical protein [Deltaproteobacteria bacterium]